MTQPSQFASRLFPTTSAAQEDGGLELGRTDSIESVSGTAATMLDLSREAGRASYPDSCRNDGDLLEAARAARRYDEGHKDPYDD